MPLPCSRTQLDKLGQRLTEQPSPVDEDLELLQQVLVAYDGVLGAVMSRLTAMGYEPTGRLKTTGTLIDKLRRHGNMGLKGMQDIAGARLVIRGTRTEQDRVVAKIVREFEALGRCRTLDRRETPSWGYRAVHVIVSMDGLPVEVQVRTEIQDLWAQGVERLADRWGRGIRYGEPPEGADQVVEANLLPRQPDQQPMTRRQVVEALLGNLSESFAQVEEVASESFTMVERAEEVEAALALLCEQDILDEGKRDELTTIRDQMVSFAASLKVRQADAEARMRGLLTSLLDGLEAMT